MTNESANVESPLQEPDGAAGKAAESLLKAIVENSEDAILSKDLNGKITSWNRAAERILGYTAEEIVGSSVLRLIPAALQSEEPEILSRLRGGQRIEHFETVRLTKSGRELPVSLTISPLKNEAGEVIGASKVLRDITQRQLMERALLQAEKLAATERMAATIAHEINNPLEAVVNLIYLAKGNLAPGTEAYGFLETAESELARMSHIAKQTLGYYRDNTAPREHQLEDLLQDAMRTYRPRFEATMVDVETRFEPVPPVLLKRGEIQQVISNLVMNAVHAMPQGGKLLLMLNNSEHHGIAGVMMSVVDTGVGIEAANVDKIFEPFYSTRMTIGTGIGLWVSKRFVEGHGGFICVDSSVEAATHGTRMSVFLPLVKPGALELATYRAGVN